jgi:hypothetical protein
VSILAMVWLVDFGVDVGDGADVGDDVVDVGVDSVPRWVTILLLVRLGFGFAGLAFKRDVRWRGMLACWYV